jgi:hypothetical protein
MLIYNKYVNNVIIKKHYKICNNIIRNKIILFHKLYYEFYNNKN